MHEISLLMEGAALSPHHVEPMAEIGNRKRCYTKSARAQRNNYIIPSASKSFQFYECHGHALKLEKHQHNLLIKWEGQGELT